MPSRHPSRDRCHAGRSLDQQRWNTAVGSAAKLWDWLTDHERLTWNVAGEARRISGYNYFIQVNARRIHNRVVPARLPPPDAPPAQNPVGELLITSHAGRLKLELRVSPPSTVPISVWASRPCNQGIAICHKCPRLGLLPAPKKGLVDISALYFAKHGPYITTHRVALPGKRIFVHTRLELEGWLKLFTPVSAVVPGRNGQAWPPQNP